MLSRHHESEMELARRGCAHLTGKHAPRILIAGLGMGYTLRQALDMLGADARVTVAELLDFLVEWNRTFLGMLNSKRPRVKRVALLSGYKPGSKTVRNTNQFL